MSFQASELGFAFYAALVDTITQRLPYMALALWGLAVKVMTVLASNRQMHAV